MLIIKVYVTINVFIINITLFLKKKLILFKFAINNINIKSI